MELRIPHKLFMTVPYARYLAEDVDSRRICEAIYKFVSESGKAWGYTVGQYACIKDKDGLHKYPVDAYYRSGDNEVIFY